MARIAGYETPPGLLSLSPGFLNGVVIELTPFLLFMFFFLPSFPWISIPFSLSSSPS